MFHGRLPSDLVPGGVGYLSHQEDRYFEWMEQRRDVSLVDLLKLAGFEVRLHHHLDFLLRMLLGFRGSNPVEEFEEALKVDDRYCHVSLSGWSAERSKLDVFSEYGNQAARDEFYSEEAEYIKQLQAEKCEGNLFFITQQQDWHDAWYTKDKRALPRSRARVEQWLSQWDFDEPDAVFWIFSDHGYQVQDDITPKDTLAWVLYRDNTAEPLRPARQLISSMDFYATILHKVGLQQYSEEARDSVSIHVPPAQVRRIFVGEDSRVKSDARFACSSVVSCLSSWREQEGHEEAAAASGPAAGLGAAAEDGVTLLMLVFHAHHRTIRGYAYDFFHENPYAYDTVDVKDLLTAPRAPRPASPQHKDWEALFQALQARFSWCPPSKVQHAIEALMSDEASAEARAGACQQHQESVKKENLGASARGMALVSVIRALAPPAPPPLQETSL